MKVLQTSPFPLGYRASDAQYSETAMWIQHAMAGLAALWRGCRNPNTITCCNKAGAKERASPVKFFWQSEGSDPLEFLPDEEAAWRQE
jgi:hypothetical protein